MNLLINNTPELAGWVTINADLEFSLLRPSLQQAQQLLTRFTGPITQTLADKQASGVALTEAETSLLSMLRMAVAPFTVLKYISAGNVSITNLGVLRNVSDGQKDAFEWQYNALHSQLREDAYTSLEALLAWLEPRLADYPAYSVFRGAQPLTLLPYAATFQQYYHIANSRLVFDALLPILRSEEKRRFVPLLTPNRHTLLATDPQPADLELLELAREALAYAVMARAARERLISVTDSGVVLNAISQFATIRYQQPADEKSLTRSLAALDKQAAATFTALQKAINPSSTSTGGPRGTGLVSF